MGLVSTKRNDDGKGGANRAAFPVIQHSHDLTVLALHVEGLAAMLGVVVHNNRRVDLHLVARLHRTKTILSPFCHGPVAGRWQKLSGPSSLTRPPRL